MERILYNTCFLHDGRYLTFNENKSFQRLGSHYMISVSFIDLLLPCVVKIIKGLKNNFKCFHYPFACHKSNFAQKAVHYPCAQRYREIIVN